MQNTSTEFVAIHELVGLNSLIGRLICSFGIPPMVRGYQYIIEAILLIIEDSNRIFLLKDEVYPSVAMRFYTTSSRVELAIRHAIEISWSWNGSESLKEQYFNNLSVPTNKQFLDFLHKRVLQSINNDVDNASIDMAQTPI